MMRMRILDRLACLVLLCLVMRSAYAVFPVELYYSKHNNEQHDAGGDMKHGLLQFYHPGSDGQGTRYFVAATAITPPNGRVNPIAGKMVRQNPSNQKDTYVLSMGAGRHYPYGAGDGMTVDVHIGAINGFAEATMRWAIEGIHRAEGLQNLRRSPVSSSYRPYLGVAIGNVNTLYAITAKTSLHGAQYLALGNLESQTTIGLYVLHGNDAAKAMPRGLPTTQWNTPDMTFYAGIYSKLIAYDLSTAYAGTKQLTPYVQTGLILPISRVLVSIKFTHYLGDLVRQQLIKTDSYIEIGIGYRF